MGTKLKPVGIIRRIDDLGRIVIPREIRKAIHATEGDPLEISIGEEEEIVLKKYKGSDD